MAGLTEELAKAASFSVTPGCVFPPLDIDLDRSMRRSIQFKAEMLNPEIHEEGS